MTSFSRPGDPVSIRAWRRLDDRITTSGQPTEDQLGLLAALGVRHVINLALHSHEDALEDEAGSVAALGMQYTHIPVDFSAPTPADFERFTALVDALEGRTVHVHCILNARVSAFFYRRARLKGLNLTEADACLDSLWRPGGVWAAFIGKPEDEALPHRFAGQDYNIGPA